MQVLGDISLLMYGGQLPPLLCGPFEGVEQTHFWRGWNLVFGFEIILALLSLWLDGFFQQSLFFPHWRSSWLMYILIFFFFLRSFPCILLVCILLLLFLKICSCGPYTIRWLSMLASFLKFVLLFIFFSFRWWLFVSLVYILCCVSFNENTYQKT